MVVFLILAFVGVVVLLMSAVFGGDHDLSAEHEFHFEHGYEAAAGADHEMGSGPSPFSLRIISLFVTAFGAVGAIARYNGASYVLSSISGLGGGFVIGGIGFQIMKLFYKQQATSTVCTDDLINSTGQVKIAIPKAGVGQICVEVKSQLRYFPARSNDGNEIEEGATVKIASCPGGGAFIVERQ